VVGGSLVGFFFMASAVPTAGLLVISIPAWSCLWAARRQRMGNESGYTDASIGEEGTLSAATESPCARRHCTHCPRVGI
jgi:hypothetical protein